MHNELVGMSWEYEDLRHYSDDYQMARGLAAVEAGERGFSNAKLTRIRANLGCHGVCALLPFLPYLTYNDVWVLGVAHTLLFGVVKDFLYMVKGTTKTHKELTGAKPFTWESAAQKKECGVRCVSFKLNVAFGRGFKDLTGKGW
jgi:hypothetical protein